MSSNRPGRKKEASAKPARTNGSKARRNGGSAKAGASEVAPVTASVSAGSLPPADDAKNNELRWQAHYSAARRFIADNNFHGAVLELKAAVKFATRLGDYRLANTFAEFGFVALRLKEFETARAFIKMAISVREKIYGFIDPSVAIEYNNLAMTFEWRKDYAGAQPYLLRAVQILEEHGRFDSVNQAEPYEGLASVFVASGQFKKAEQLCMKAIQIRDEHLGRLHPLSMKTVQFLIEIRRAAGNSLGALAARDIYSQRLSEYARSKSNTATVETMRRLLAFQQSSEHKDRFDSCIGDFLKLMTRR